MTLDVTTDYPWDGKVRHQAPRRRDREVRAPAPRARLVRGGDGRRRRREGRAVRPSTGAISSWIASGRTATRWSWTCRCPCERIAANPNVKADARPARHPARAAGLLPGGRATRASPLASLYLPAGREARGREADRPARRRGGREGTGRDGRGAGLDEHPVPADRAVVAGADHGDPLLRLGQPQGPAR